MKKLFEELFDLKEQVQILLIGLNGLLAIMTIITLYQEVLYGSIFWGIIQFVLMSGCLICLDCLLWGLYN